MNARTWSTSATCVYGGALLVAVSAFLPWVNTADGSDSASISPLGLSVLRPAVILLIVALALGAGLLRKRNDPSLIGCVGALWLNTTLVVWLAGARLASFVPDSVVPDHVALHLGPGATSALVGGLVLIAGVVLELSDLSWNYQAPSLMGLLPCLGLVLLVAAIAVRGLGWLDLTAGDFRWSLDIDVLPLVGDAMTIALIGCAVVLLILVLSPRRWAIVMLAALGFSVSFLSIIAYLAKSLADKYGRSLIRRLPFVDDPNVKVTLAMTAGPICSFILGLAIVGYSVAQWRITPTTGGIRARVRSIAPRPSTPDVSSPADQLPF